MNRRPLIVASVFSFRRLNEKALTVVRFCERSVICIAYCDAQIVFSIRNITILIKHDMTLVRFRQSGQRDHRWGLRPRNWRRCKILQRHCNANTITNTITNQIRCWTIKTEIVLRTTKKCPIVLCTPNGVIFFFKHVHPNVKYF